MLNGTMGAWLRASTTRKAISESTPTARADVSCFDKPENDATQSQGCQQRASIVKSGTVLLTPAFRHAPEQNGQHDHCHRHVDKEHPAPRSILDQPASQDRSQDRSDC